MSDSCATTPPPASSGDYANVIINCQCSLFNDSSSRLLNTPNHRYVTKIAIQVHRCVSKLLIPRRSCITVATIRSPPPSSHLSSGYPSAFRSSREDENLSSCLADLHTSPLRRMLDIVQILASFLVSLGMCVRNASHVGTMLVTHRV